MTGEDELWHDEVKRIFDALTKHVPHQYITDDLIKAMGWCPWCNRKLSPLGGCSCIGTDERGEAITVAHDVVSDFISINMKFLLRDYPGKYLVIGQEGIFSWHDSYEEACDWVERHTVPDDVTIFSVPKT